jgi:hypothetical protein
MGFEVEFIPSTAYAVPHKADAKDRWTIIARRAENIAIDDSHSAPTEAEAAAEVAESRIRQAEDRAKAIEAEHAAALDRIATLHASASWRLTEQNNMLQTKALRAAGCKRLFEEIVSGGRWDRPELHRLLDHMR